MLSAIQRREASRTHTDRSSSARCPSWLRIQSITLRQYVFFLRSTWALRRPVDPLPTNDDPRLIVSLTSFPGRIRTVWASIATVMRQTLRPDAIILVLADEEFPRRTLPRSLRRLERRGLRVLRTSENLRSHNKFLPARMAHPHATIITVDDDVLYEAETVERLVRSAAEHPNTIVGHRGWRVQWDERGPTPYFQWMRHGRADPSTHTDRVFLTGVGGILYPPGLPADEHLLDPLAAVRLTPTADDVWFWAASIASRTPRHCTGFAYGRSSGLEGMSRALLDTNRSANDVQIAAAIEHFGLTAWFEERHQPPALPSSP